MNAAKSGIELANVKMSMNPFDEIATEEGQKGKREVEGSDWRKKEGSNAHLSFLLSIPSP